MDTKFGRSSLFGQNFILVTLLRGLFYLEKACFGSSTQPEMSTNDDHGLVVSFKEGPVNDAIVRKKIVVLRIQNESVSQRFYFKIKSNANKRFLAVTANRGIVEPNQAVESVVTLRFNGTIDWKRYKILVQYIPTSDGETDLNWRDAFSLRCKDLRQIFLELAPMINQKKLMFKRTVEYFEGSEKKGAEVWKWEPNEMEQLNLQSHFTGHGKVQGVWNAGNRPPTPWAKGDDGTAPSQGQNVQSPSLWGQVVSNQAQNSIGGSQSQEHWGQDSNNRVQSGNGVQNQWGQWNQVQNGCGNQIQQGRGLNAANQEQDVWGSNENNDAQHQDLWGQGTTNVNQVQDGWGQADGGDAQAQDLWGQASNTVDQAQGGWGQDGGDEKNQWGQIPRAANQQDAWGSNENAGTQDQDLWGQGTTNVNQDGWGPADGGDKWGQGSNAVDQAQDGWGQNHGSQVQDAWNHQKQQNILDQLTPPKCEERTAVGGSLLNQCINDFQGADFLCLLIIPVLVFVFGLILGKAGL